MGRKRVAGGIAVAAFVAGAAAFLPASVAQVPGPLQPTPASTPAPTPAPTPAATAGPTAPPPAPQPTPPPAERRVVYSVSQQRVWLYETGDVEVATWLVSGRRGVPRAGSYRVFSRSRHSGNGSVRMQYMVRFARGPRWSIGFHSIPVTGRGRPIQSEAELGRYRSHGCVRQRVSDAARMWDFAQQGTLVVVRA